MRTKLSTALFPTLVQDYFCQYLINQRGLSSKTIASYRDAFRLLLGFAQTRTGKPPEDLDFTDLDAPLILAFLEHLEKQRRNTVQSRNARLAAIRSFMRYAAFRNPASLQTTQRVLGIPMKRFDHKLFEFLSREEMQAVLNAPNCLSWSGRRDHVMFATFYNTGARISEIISLRTKDVFLNGNRFLRINGKGRKQRTVPLWKSTAVMLKDWIKHLKADPDAPVFSNRNGKPLSRTGIEGRLDLAVEKAAIQCLTLRNRRISPHSLRHTTAMHLLQSGVDITVIALWLGHVSPATTHLYVEADLEMKANTLKKVQEPSGSRLRYRSTDRLLSFLDGL